MDALRNCDYCMFMTIQIISEECLGAAQVPAGRTRVPQNVRFVGALTEATFRTLG
jgi:hypothetical protein